MNWFNIGWWRYLLTGQTHVDLLGNYWPRRARWGWTCFWCRLHGHPAGPVWQNVGGVEPDMHCENCGDDLG